MIFLQVLVDLIAWGIQHWREVTLFGVINFVAVALGKRIGMRQLQRFFGIGSEVKEYVANQKKIMADIEAIKSHLGVTCGQPNELPTVAQSLKKPSLLSQMAIPWGSRLRRKKWMNKLKSRKFWMAIIAALLPVINDQFDIGLNTESVIAAIGAIVAFILGEAHVDAKRAGNEVKPDGDSQSTVTNEPRI